MMAKLLALEWDPHEARIVLARTRGSEIVVEQALSVDLSPRDDGGEVNVGQRIAAALSACGVTCSETLVAVGRTNIELRQLSLPIAPLEELPELVRFQSIREFSSIDESWPIDFALLATGGEEAIHVLAAAISPKLIEQIQQTCRTGGLTSKRIVLRPFAAAALMKRKADLVIGRHDVSSSDTCCLMVDLLAEEADLTVLLDGEVAFVRTVRIPASNEDNRQTPVLLGEIRRTMLAAQNQLGGRRIEQIVLCGDEKNHAQLLPKLAEELNLDVALFNPFEEFTLGAELASRPVEHPGRYAPLLGMLQEEVAGHGHAIDFLHPRKKAEPPNQLLRLVLIGAAAAAVLFLLIGILGISLWSKNAEIKRLQTKANSRQLNDSVKDAEIRRAELAEIEKFLAGDINWLEELSELSQEFPESEKSIVTQLQAGSLSKGGKIILDGYAVDYSTIDAIEFALRDSRHQVSGRGGKEDDARVTYRWLFNETVLVEKPKTTGNKKTSRPAGRQTR